MRYTQGEPATPPPSATFRNWQGTLVDPQSVTIDLFDANDVLVVNNGVPTRLSLGLYEYPYEFAEGATLGIWHIVWSAVIDGAAVEGDEYFEVVLAGEITINAVFSRLRRMVGDRIPPGKTDDDTFFSDEEIADLFDQANENLNRAAMFGWFAKMAEFAKLIDRNTSGADLPMSQMYKNAERMFKHYAELAGEDTAAVVGRIVGRAINLRETPCTQVMTGSGTYRTELYSTTARRLLLQAEPDLATEDPTYPQVGQVAT